jgi:predicted metal-dependent hydrolase
MQKTINLSGQAINYTHRSSKRSRSLRLTIRQDGKLTLSTPRLLPQFLINIFLKKKSAWIIDKIAYFKSLPPQPPKLTKSEERKEFAAYKKLAQDLAESRVAHFVSIYGYTYGKISIKNQKTRWGSCSKRGNLNFSYKIALLPRRLLDYIVVHEVCHLGEFNHSRNFWNLVAKTVLDYRECQAELKKVSLVRVIN